MIELDLKWIPIAAYVVATLVNGLLHYEHPSHKAPWKVFLRTVLDRISIHPYSDSPGTLKPPLTASRKPEATYIKERLRMSSEPPPAPGDDADTDPGAMKP